MGALSFYASPLDQAGRYALASGRPGGDAELGSRTVQVQAFCEPQPEQQQLSERGFGLDRLDFGQKLARGRKIDRRPAALTAQVTIGRWRIAVADAVLGRRIGAPGARAESEIVRPAPVADVVTGDVAVARV